MWLKIVRQFNWLYIIFGINLIIKIMNELVGFIEVIGIALGKGKDVLESFFLKFLVFKEFPGIPQWLGYGINGLIVSLIFWTALPSIVILFKRSPTILEKLLGNFFDVIESVIDYCKKLLMNRVPYISNKLLSMKLYGNIFLWTSATDGEALLRVIENEARVKARRLTPYHKQIAIGLVVVLIAIWSSIGFGIAMMMSFSGSTSLDVTEITLTQQYAVLISSIFFGLFILSLDRVLVSSSVSGWAYNSFSWFARLLISLILASWVSSAYNVLLNEKSIEDNLIDKAKVKLAAARIQAASDSLVTYSKILADQSSTPQCAAIKKNIDAIPARLALEETLDCPEGRKINCIGSTYKLIQKQQQELQDDFIAKCPKRTLTEIENQIEEANKARLEKLTEEEAHPEFDLSIATDVLQEIGLNRREIILAKIKSPDFIDFFKIWITFQPNLTFLVLMIIDLIPLIVKFFSKSSYTYMLEIVEAARRKRTLTEIKVAQQDDGWDPFDSDSEAKKEKWWFI
jgi:hypothetical protein